MKLDTWPNLSKIVKRRVIIFKISDTVFKPNFMTLFIFLLKFFNTIPVIRVLVVRNVTFVLGLIKIFVSRKENTR